MKQSGNMTLTNFSVLKISIFALGVPFLNKVDFSANGIGMNFHCVLVLFYTMYVGKVDFSTTPMFRMGHLKCENNSILHLKHLLGSIIPGDMVFLKNNHYDRASKAIFPVKIHPKQFRIFEYFRVSVSWMMGFSM